MTTGVNPEAGALVVCYLLDPWFVTILRLGNMAPLNKTLWHFAYSVVLSGLSVEETRVQVTSGSIPLSSWATWRKADFFMTKVAGTRKRSIRSYPLGNILPAFL
jgi:hypothetical protein